MSLHSVRNCFAAACLLAAGFGWCFENAARAADEYGNLTGQFVLDGDPPKLADIVMKGAGAVKDAAVCAANAVPNETLVVDSKSKGIANIFIYEKKAKEVHPDLKKSASPDVVFDQKGCKFIPHALFVRADQVVLVKSDDSIAHNTHTFPLRNQPHNQAIKPSERTGVPYKVSVGESLPIQVKCDFHPWMSAYWLILDHPYGAITDADGKFEIKNLPAGKHEFVVWQESCGYVERKLEVEIKGGATKDLGAVKVPLSKLLKK